MNVHPGDKSLESLAMTMIKMLGLNSEPVAVFLIGPNGVSNLDLSLFSSLKSQRYCQMIMHARRGEAVSIDAANLSCPAAARAFGFRELPDKLAGGDGLVGFGIVQDPLVGKAMFKGMPRIQSGELSLIAACPLSKSQWQPDVVVVEGLAEQLMWIALADLNSDAGARRQSSTAVLQATCVDSTIIPYIEQRLNFSLGCYGCREATDMEPSETIIGFPGARLHAIVDSIRYLNIKAITNSRSKRVYEALRRKEKDNV